MKRLWIPAAMLALMLGCSEDGSNQNTTDDLSLQEQDENAAIITAEAIALESGGLLESLEFALTDDANDAGIPDLAGKNRFSDEALFDSSTCIWTITQTRGREHEHAGFTWTQTRTLHFMDALGECVVQRGDSTIRALDLTRTFSGESWNPRRQGEKSGTAAWALRSLHDATPGAEVDGSHLESGQGVVHRVRPNGQEVDLTYEYQLDVTGTDLVVLLRNGRRIPIAGTLHIVYDAERNGRQIHRDIIITFGEGGGAIDLGDGPVYTMNPVSGEVAF